MTVTLVTIATGPLFERYAADLLDSAATYFRPSVEVQLVRLTSEPGWPQASLTRYRAILAAQDALRGDYIFLSDADNRFEGTVGTEILAKGIVVTTHPGYQEPDDEGLCPFERRRESLACVDRGVSRGRLYHPGAFVGGSREAFLRMADMIDSWITQDAANGIVAEWHDESYLNRYLIYERPALILSGDYCYWEHWGDHPPNGETRRIVHRDKTPAEVEERGSYGVYECA